MASGRLTAAFPMPRCTASRLRDEGTPQGGDTSEHISPLPDLEEALKLIEVDAPTTTILLNGRPPRPGSYVDPLVTLDADDGWGSGVDRTSYRIDGGGWSTYEGPFRVLERGEHTIEYRSNDLNGNAEHIRSLTFKNRGRSADAA